MKIIKKIISWLWDEITDFIIVILMIGGIFFFGSKLAAWGTPLSITSLVLYEGLLIVVMYKLKKGKRNHRKK